MAELNNKIRLTEESKETTGRHLIDIRSIEGPSTKVRAILVLLKDKKEGALDLANQFLHKWKNKIDQDYEALVDKSPQDTATCFVISLQKKLLTQDWDPHVKPKIAVNSLIHRCKVVKGEIEQRLLEMSGFRSGELAKLKEKIKDKSFFQRGYL